MSPKSLKKHILYFVYQAQFVMKLQMTVAPGESSHTVIFTAGAHDVHKRDFLHLCQNFCDKLGINNIL